jgi:hypothetical protein
VEAPAKTRPKQKALRNLVLALNAFANFAAFPLRTLRLKALILGHKFAPKKVLKGKS